MSRKYGNIKHLIQSGTMKTINDRISCWFEHIKDYGGQWSDQEIFVKIKAREYRAGILIVKGKKLLKA